MKEEILFLSHAVSTALTCILIYFWTLAFINGGSMVMTVNDYGESIAELLTFIVLVPFLIYGFYLTYRKFIGDKIE